jgi:hypothetical protein
MTDPVEIPEEFLCPISYELMEDPVLLGGHSFERQALTAWLAQRPINPLTNEQVNPASVVSNFALREAIRRWKTQNTVSAQPRRPEAKNPMRTFRVDRTDNYYKISCVSPDAQELCLIAVLDVSGSMDSPAGLSDGPTEGGTFSRLDLVKHSTRTVGAMVAERNAIVPTYFGVVTFSDTAKTRFPLRRMTAENLDELNATVNGFVSEGGTNIWDGLRAGLEMAAYAARMHPDANVQVMLLTDGEPTPSYTPLGGIAQSLERKLASMPGAPVVSVFGFGTALDTKLLNEIVDIGCGVYGYSSDASMVGTTFVHYCAAALATCVRNVWVNNIWLGNLTVGGTKAIQLPGVISTVAITYDNEQTATVDVEANDAGSAEFEDICYQLTWRMSRVLGTDTEATQAVVDIREIADRCRKGADSDPRITALLQDLEDPDPNKGQLSKAVSRSDWWNSWGKNHMISYMRALICQQCPNFKEAGPAVFKQGLVNDLCEMGSTLFNNLPAQKPSLRSSWGSGHGPANMAAYNNANGGCFVGTAKVKMADGSECLVNRLQSGMLVSGGHKILCVIRTPLRGQSTLTQLPGPENLFITPWHPVKKGTGEAAAGALWEFPNAVQFACTHTDGHTMVYNLVLETGHTIEIGDWTVCTLGHGFEGPVIGHRYFGTQAVIEDLKNTPGWARGYIQLNQFGPKRGEDGLIEKIC